MTAPDALVSELRALTKAFKKGDQRAALAFRDLASKLLHLTVLDRRAQLRLISSPEAPENWVLGGAADTTDPLLLNDGRYLRLSVWLFRERVRLGHRLKVRESSVQYQVDREGKRWVFRYDYIRRPPRNVPAAHLQLRGALDEACLPDKTPLSRVHFPTMRVSLESVIRLLVREFHVRCNEDEEIWGPALEQTEREFHSIAHLPV